MLYLKIDPKKMPRQFVDFIVADVAAFSEVSMEAGIAVEAAELTQTTVWISSVTTTATAAAEVGEATTITFTIDMSAAEIFAAEGVF